MRVLGQLCDLYIAADLAVELLQTVIVNAGLQLSAPRSGLLQQPRTSVSPLNIIDKERPQDKYISQAIRDNKPASDMSINGIAPLLTMTDEFPTNVWPSLSPYGHAPGYGGG
jgi:hypothetical protein